MATLTLGGSLSLAGQLPAPARLGGEVIPGTVNLVLNPVLESATVGTDGWAGGAGVTVSRDTATFFEGAASLRAVFAAGPGTPAVTIATASGLYWTGAGFVIGSIYARGVFAGLTLTLSAQYTDATIESGEAVEIDAGTPDEWARPVATLALNPDKVLNTLFLTVERAVGETGGTVNLDAAQVERDAGWGVTPVAAGSYGAPYHRWVGQAHRSASIRDDIPADVTQLGRDGEHRITWTMWRADASFRLLEDLSAHVISASVTADRSRQAAWTMTCRMDQAGWARLRPWDDWLVPVLYVTDAQGVTRSGFLGHYVVLPSPVTHYEHMGEYDIDCRSAEYLLAQQAFKGKLVIAKGTHLSRTAAWVIESSALGNSQIRPRLQMIHPNKLSTERYEFSREQSKLAIANELLEAANMQPVWSSRSGILRSQRTDTQRYQEMQPVRLWAANFDPRVATGRVRKLASELPASSRDISGVVRRIPSLGDAENEITVYTTDPRQGQRRATYTITDPTNPISVTWTGRWRNKAFGRRMLPAGSGARDLARALAEEVGTRIDQVELSVIPDPEPDLLDKVVYLAVYRIDGAPAAVGRFRVLKIEYGFTVSNALMKLTLGFVHGVAELQGGMPVRHYDQRNQTWFEDTGQAIELSITG